MSFHVFLNLLTKRFKQMPVESPESPESPADSSTGHRPLLGIPEARKARDGSVRESRESRESNDCDSEITSIAIYCYHYIHYWPVLLSLLSIDVSSLSLDIITSLIPTLLFLCIMVIIIGSSLWWYFWQDVAICYWWPNSSCRFELTGPRGRLGMKGGFHEVMGKWCPNMSKLIRWVADEPEQIKTESVERFRNFGKLFVVDSDPMNLRQADWLVIGVDMRYQGTSTPNWYSVRKSELG